MRNLTTQQQKILSLDNYNVEHRVYIEKADGTFQNMSDLEGYDWLQNINWNADIDTITKQATIQVSRDIYYLSTNPLIEKSKLNIDESAIYKPLIEIGRRIYIESAIIPVNQKATETDFFEVFRGFIYDIDTSDNPVTLTLYDRSGRLQSFIESEQTYGANDGSVLAEDVIQAILDNKFTAGKYNLYTPVSTGFAIEEYQQKKEPVISACDNIVKNFGWNLEHRWDNSTNQFRFTLYEPPRSKTTPDYTFQAKDYYNVNQLKFSLETIRNKITGTYSDSTTGNRETRTVSDTTSIQTYGKLVGDDGNIIYVPAFMEITEASTSQIDTEAEMLALLNAVLSDLKDPKATVQVTVRYFPFVQLNDLIRLKANNIHFDTDQDLAVIAYNHNLQSNETTLTLRGKPAGAYDQWLLRDARPGIAPVSKFPQAPTISIETGLETDKAFVTAYADISLSQVGEVNIYEIQYKQSTASTWEKFNIQENETRISNLITNVSYDIRVRGTLINGGVANLNYTSQFSTAGFTTPADDQAPTPPVIKEVIPLVRGFAVIMNEETPTGVPRSIDFNRYKVYVSTTSGFTPSATNLTDTGNKSRFEINGLVAGETYYIKVTSVDYSENESNSSAEESATAKTNVYAQTNDPTANNDVEIDDLWHDTDDNQLKKWNGTSWDVISNNFTDTSQLTDGANLGETANWSGVSNDNGNRPVDNADITKRSSTITIAAYNSSASGRAGADYVCTGTNDEAIINQALYNLYNNSAKSGKVALLEGTYNISDRITVYDNTILDGMGQNTLLKLQSDFNTSATQMINLGEGSSVNNGLKLSDVLVDVSLVTSSMLVSSAIHVFSNQSQCLNVKIIGQQDYTDGISVSYDVSDIKLDSCYIENCERGLDLGDSLCNVENVKISQNTILSCDIGIDVSYGDFTITENTIKDCIQEGVILSNSTSSQVSKNKVFGCDIGIKVINSDDNMISTNICKGNTIDNIYIQDSDYNNVTGNLCRSNGVSDYGIRVNSGIDNFVDLNDLYSAGTIADFTAVSGSTVTLAGNRT